MISFDDLKNFTKLRSGYAIVESDWAYDYDTYYDTYDIDFSVPPEWVGKRARDCVFAWEYCMIPKRRKNSPEPEDVVLPFEEK